jgi:septin family protein
MTKFKIVIAGPKGTGKSLIGNHLVGVNSNSNNAEQLLVASKYDPTAGVRILETEMKLSGLTYTEDCGIEIWDSSGDHK